MAVFIKAGLFGLLGLGVQAAQIETWAHTVAGVLNRAGGGGLGSDVSQVFDKLGKMLDANAHLKKYATKMNRPEPISADILNYLLSAGLSCPAADDGNDDDDDHHQSSCILGNVGDQCYLDTCAFPAFDPNAKDFIKSRLDYFPDVTNDSSPFAHILSLVQET